MIRKLKKHMKKASDSFWDFFFRRIETFPFLKYYPKGRNHLYDILVEEKTNSNFIVFDVGANIGQSALYYNKLLNNPKIFSFEPINTTFSKLVQNTRIFSNVKNFNFALGEKENSIEIKISDDLGYKSLKSEVFSKLALSGKQIVEIKTIDKVYNYFGIDKINLLKIDTEGYDLEVLNGAVNLLSHKKIDYIYCEVAFNNEPDKGNFYEINKLLRSYDFWLCGFYDVSRWGRNFSYVSFYNALFKHIEE